MVEVQGSTHNVEPVDGGPVKRVHRANLRTCVGPVPTHRVRKSGVLITLTTMSTVVREGDPDPEFVVLEETTYPELDQRQDIDKDKIPGKDSKI